MSAWRNWGTPPVLPLAPHERVLWQGAPCPRRLAERLFHIRAAAFYFAGLTLVDMAIVRLHDGGGWPVVEGGLPTAVTGLACVLILAGLAWASARTTRYTITTRRVIMQFGLALPATLMLPLHRIAGSSVRVRADHTGDVCLRLLPGEQIGFVKLWPHARPWRLFAPEPMLRDLPRAAIPANLLTRALVACAEAKREASLAASLPPPAVVTPARASVPAE